MRVVELVRLLRLGRPENRFDRLGDRVKYFTLMVLGQRGVLRDPLPGVAHFFTFWGFLIIQLDALNLWAMGFNFELPIVSSRPFAVLLDFFLLAAFLALAAFTYRRAVLRPKQLGSQLHGMADAYTILGLITLVLVTLFGFEVFGYVASAGTLWTPVRRAHRRRVERHPCPYGAGAREHLLVGQRARGARLPDLPAALEAPAPDGDALQCLLPQLSPQGRA